MPAWDRLGGRIVVAATLLGWVAVAALIASSYFGHSSSPYGTCEAPSGRIVSCALLAKR